MISLGFFLEQMQIAAAEKRVGVRFDIYPDGEDGPVAVAVFEPRAAPGKIRFLLQYLNAGPVNKLSPTNRWWQMRQKNYNNTPRLFWIPTEWLG